MKKLLNSLCLLSVFTAWAAFNSEEWLEKRAMFVCEAERLQAAYSNCVARVVDPAKDVTVPIEMFPNGSVKTSVVAKKAMFFLDTNLVWAQNVCVRRFDEDGKVVSQIDARNCVIDRLTKSGWAEGRARLRHHETIFEGEGIYFSSPEGYVSVRQNAQVESKDLKFGGVL